MSQEVKKTEHPHEFGIVKYFDLANIRLYDSAQPEPDLAQGIERKIFPSEIVKMQKVADKIAAGEQPVPPLWESSLKQIEKNCGIRGSDKVKSSGVRIADKTYRGGVVLFEAKPHSDPNRLRVKLTLDEGTYGDTRGNLEVTYDLTPNGKRFLVDFLNTKPSRWRCKVAPTIESMASLKMAVSAGEYDQHLQSANS